MAIRNEGVRVYIITLHLIINRWASLKKIGVYYKEYIL
jgi:hypothetical protein